MAKKHLFIALLILAAALLLGGLIYCRPTAAANYADGLFNFDAVDEITVHLTVYTAGTTAKPGTQESYQFTLTEEDPAFSALIDRFDGRGFGRTLGNLIPRGEGYVRTHPLAEGEVSWNWYISFRCSVSNGFLSMENWHGELSTAGHEILTVTTNDKDQWIGKVTQLLTELIPEEEPEENMAEE